VCVCMCVRVEVIINSLDEFLNTFNRQSVNKNNNNKHKDLYFKRTQTRARNVLASVYNESKAVGVI